jgi:hypothetical protein
MLRSEFLFPTLFAHVLKDISERMLDQLLSMTISTGFAPSLKCHPEQLKKF